MASLKTRDGKAFLRIRKYNKSHQIIDRYLSAHFARHLRSYRQMLFLSGPRQVGKMTAARKLGEAISDFQYFNWDDPMDRKAILDEFHAIAQRSGADRITDCLPLCVFDELHKYKHWHDFLKDMFDRYESQLRFLVAGGASRFFAWRR